MSKRKACVGDIIVFNERLSILDANDFAGGYGIIEEYTSNVPSLPYTISCVYGDGDYTDACFFNACEFDLTGLNIRED
jgi:hypothetical protein